MTRSDAPVPLEDSALGRLSDLLELQAGGDLDVDDADELGRLLRERGEIDASVKILAVAVGRHPTEGWLRHNYAEALLAAGLDAQAAREYEQAGVLGGDVEDLELAADLYSDLEDWEALERVATAGLALDPARGAFLLWRANALDDLGRFDEAERGYRHAIALAPADPDVLFNFGLFLKRRARHEEALGLLSRATRIDPQLAIAWMNLADVLEVTGDDAGASEARRRARAIEGSEVVDGP